MRWHRLLQPLVVLASAAVGCSSPPPPEDPSRIPPSFALVRSDFPEGYEFYDDRDLRELDMVRLGGKDKDPRLPDYSKLTLDHLSAQPQACSGLVDLGRRPAYRAATSPATPASAGSRSSLGYDQRTATSIVFTVSLGPLPLEQHRQALAGCAQLAVRSEQIGPGQGALVPVAAPDGGLGYDLEAQLQSPSGIEYAFSRVLIAAPVGQGVVVGAMSRVGSAQSAEQPLDQAALRSMLGVLIDKVKKG